MDNAANAIMGLAKCLWGLLAEPVTYIYDPTKDLRLLEDELQRLVTRSVDVKNEVEVEEARQGGKCAQQVDGWLKEVQQLQVESLKLIQEGKSFQHSKCLVRCSPTNCRSSYKLGKKVTRLLTDVKKCRAEGKFDALVIRLLPQVPEMPIEETVGLDSMLSKVWEWLQDKHVGIIGLWGMGGVGKTTLLKKIIEKYRHTSKKEFDIILWIVVSKQVNLEKIRESIRNDLGIGNDVWSNLTEDARAAELYKVLKTKKFVVLIDDIWEKLDVAKIGIPLPNPTNGSKIVFTTRSREVCGQMEARKSLKVECLLFQQAFELFQEKVRQATLYAHPDIMKHANDIVKECKGLPLALITIGRAMATRKNPLDWEYASNVLRSYPSDFSMMDDDVYKLLEFSYQSLNNPTFQQCFLYCALFPEDCVIGKNHLIDLWIGEGFLSDRYDIHGARLKGEYVIGSLKSACLVEGGLLEGGEDEDEDKDGVRMHDVIRDMALWIAREHGKGEDKIVVEEEHVYISRWKEAERVSLQGRRIRISHVTEQSICSRLTTLLINETELETLPEGFFNSLHVLKVLDMSNNVNFRKLPTGVGNLANLQYLNLSGTHIEALPNEMKNLTSLLYLLLDYTYNLEIIPKEVISSLSSLKVFRQSRAFAYSDEEGLVEALEGLDRLNELSLDVHTAFGIQKSLESPNLQQRMTSLKITYNSDLPTINIPTSSLGKFLRLNGLVLACCDALESIEINEEVPRRVNDRLSSGLEWTNLHDVVILICDKLRNLSWLIYAPNLRKLNVERCRSLEKIIDEDIIDENASARLFSSLTSLRLWDLPNLKSIHSRTLSAPSLREIYIGDCPKLKKLPFDSNSGRNSLMEVRGEPPVWWSGLEWDDEAAKAFFTSKRVDRLW